MPPRATRSKPGSRGCKVMARPLASFQAPAREVVD
jgi:hypothetical protein